MQMRIARLDPQEFDWVLLRSFLAIYRAGSLAAAARQQSLQQPTLSRHLIELESQLGAQLFERSSRGLHPTAAAQQILVHAQAMEEAAHQLCLGLASRGEALTGTVRVYATQMIATTLLPDLLTGLLQAYPGLQIELLASDALPDLLSRDADIGFWISPPKQLDIVSRKLGEFRIVACASQGYLEQHGEPLAVEDLARHRLLGNDKLDTMTQWFKQVGVPLGQREFSLRTDDKAAYLGALKAGAGIGFAASYLLAANPELRPVLPGLPLPRLPLWLNTHREIASNRLIKTVFDTLASEVGLRLNA